MLRLAISGLSAQWREATGHDDILLAETAGGLAAVIAWIGRCVERADGEPIDAAALPVGDLDRLVVARRRDLRSDRFVAEADCARCGAAVDVTFSLTAYAQHCRPRAARGATPDGPGWWRLAHGSVSFRLPNAGDVVAAQGSTRPRTALLRRCVRGEADRRQEAAVERAMSRLAPTLSTQVTGVCPDCGAATPIEIDARELCLTELRFAAATVHEDVHLIASAYGWSEREILDLPSARRRRYAELIAGDGSEAVSLG